MGGFSLPSVIVSAAIGFIVMVSATSLLTGLAVDNERSRQTPACVGRANLLIGKFKNSDNKLIVDNWQSSGGALTPAGLANPERFSTFGILQPNTALLTWDKVNTWTLINNGTNWALALYNLGGYCLNNGFQLPDTSPYYPSGPKLRGEQVFLKIERHDITAGSYDCNLQGSLRLFPMGITNQTVAPGPINDVGLRLTVKVNYQEPNGLQKACEAQTEIKPDADSQRPSFATVPQDIIPGSEMGACPGPGCPCNAAPDFTCVSNTQANMQAGAGVPISVLDRNIRISFATNEPGVVFGCELRYADAAPPAAPLGQYRFCNNLPNQVIATGTETKTAQFSTSKVHGAGDSISGIQLQLSNLPHGFGTLFITSFDSAGNQSAVIAKQSFQIKTTCPVSVNPAQCPLDGTPVSQGSCPAGTCTTNNIARYRALVMAVQRRGQALCINQPNWFVDDANCAGAQAGTPVCDSSFTGLTAVSCVDGSTVSPFMTVGYAQRQLFGMSDPITLGQAITFSERAVIEGVCGDALVKDLYNGVGPKTIAQRQAQIGGADILWPYLYIAWAFGIITQAEAAASGANDVSDADMSGYMNGLQAALAAQGSCDNFKNFVLAR